MRLAWAGPPALLALLALLAFKVLLSTTQNSKCLKVVGYLTKPVSHAQTTLVGHFKEVLLKDLLSFNQFSDMGI